MAQGRNILNNSSGNYCCYWVYLKYDYCLLYNIQFYMQVLKYVVQFLLFYDCKNTISVVFVLAGRNSCLRMQQPAKSIWFSL